MGGTAPEPAPAEKYRINAANPQLINRENQGVLQTGQNEEKVGPNGSVPDANVDNKPGVSKPSNNTSGTTVATQNAEIIKYTQSCTKCKLNPYTQCSDHKTDVLFTITHAATAAANTGSTPVTIMHINNEYSLHKGKISDITKFLRYYPPTPPKTPQTYLNAFKTAANQALVEYYWGVCTETTMRTCVVILAVRCLQYLCVTANKAPANLYTPADNTTPLSSIIQSCLTKQHNDKLSEQYLTELKTACGALETFAQTQGITKIDCDPLPQENDIADIIVAINTMCECVYKSPSPPTISKK